MSKWIESILLTGTYAGQGAGGADAIAEVSTEAYLPPNPENFTYDDDGNLTSDSRWTYTWNGENRLVAMETTTTAITAGIDKVKLVFAYDSQGRRFKKEFYTWDSGSSQFILSDTTVYLYDGWNLLSEENYDATLTLLSSKYYTWGTDLSGTLQGAGGVGGLLATTTDEGAYYPAYDGNGNILAYLDSVTGATAAEFEYGPFGQTLRATGKAAAELPLRFSTKYTDPETGLLYYGYRYCDPELGRWLSRDPIEERGGLNLYVFVSNDGVNRWDYLGLLSDFDVWLAILSHWAAPNGQASFIRSGGEWAEFFKDYPAVQVQFRVRFRDELEKLWSSSRDSGSFEPDVVSIVMNRSGYLVSTLNGVRGYVTGDYKIDRNKCEINFTNLSYEIQDRADWDHPGQNTTADDIIAFFYFMGQGDDGFGTGAWDTSFDFFDISITWTGPDLDFLRHGSNDYELLNYPAWPWSSNEN